MAQAFLDSVKQQLFSWFARAQAADVDPDLADLPDGVQAQLTQKIQALPPPEIYQTTIRDALTTAIQAWQHNADASNTLVILASPTEAIADVLKSSLDRWPDGPGQTIMPLPCGRRSPNPLAMAQQIQQALEAYEQIDLSGVDSADGLDSDLSLDRRTTLVIVPALEACFLRCIGGWNGVEYLRDVALHNRDCFWVIGCNRLAWRFLDAACQLSAYFDQVTILPKVDGDMLRDWLAPLGKTVIESGQRENSPKSWRDLIRTAAVNVDDNSEDSQQLYWNSLVTQSLGVAAIAVRLWQSSLRLKPEQLNAELPPLDPPDGDTAETAGDRLLLHEIAPALPKLPKLTSPDRYLLHALLIHGPMTRAHLALSLGESERQTQASIQKLLREQVIAQRSGRLAVQVLHYPKLRTDLASNNFFLEED